MASASRIPRLPAERQNWEDLAAFDLYWSILSEPGNHFRQIDASPFFASGAREINNMLGHAAEHGLPAVRNTALDFGCGAGRLTRALAHHFGRVLGVDISRGMIAEARRLNRDIPNCTFECTSESLLTSGRQECFDLIYSSIVLQHLPGERIIQSYIEEFVQLLAPGGLAVFQLASALPLRNRIQPRRRAYQALRRIGVPPESLMKTLHLNPIRMTAVPKDRILHTVRLAGAEVLSLETERLSGGVESTTYYVAR